MSDEIMDDNQSNPSDEVTDANQPQTEDVGTPKETEPEQYSEREKRYYARMKQAENITKQVREELAKVKRPTSNIDAIIEVQEATRDLSASEIEELKMRADALKLTLSEARKNENFVLWQKAYKEKVDKENVPLPSTTQGNAQGKKSWKDLPEEERQKLWEDIGLTTKRIRPLPPRQ